MKITITVEDDSGEVQTYRVSTAEDDPDSASSSEFRSNTETDVREVEMYDAGSAPVGSNGSSPYVEAQDDDANGINVGSFG